eukprot:PhM_4_TR14670/c0_g1_i1/m.87689
MGKVASPSVKKRSIKSTKTTLPTTLKKRAADDDQAPHTTTTTTTTTSPSSYRHDIVRVRANSSINAVCDYCLRFLYVKAPSPTTTTTTKKKKATAAKSAEEGGVSITLLGTGRVLASVLRCASRLHRAVPTSRVAVMTDTSVDDDGDADGNGNDRNTKLTSAIRAIITVPPDGTATTTTTTTTTTSISSVKKSCDHQSKGAQKAVKNKR